MRKPSPLPNLIATIAAYFVLWWLVPRATFLVYLTNALDALMPFARGETAGYLGAVGAAVIAAPTVAFMAIQIALVFYFAKLRMSLWRTLAVLVGCLAGVALILTLVIWQSGIADKIGHYPNLREHFYILGNYFGPFKTPISLLMMFAAAAIGYAVSLRIRDRNLLLPVVMLAAYIDFWTVTRGPVATVLEKAPDVVSAVSAPIPQVGAGAFVPSTYIGPGDFLFMTLVFAVIHKLGMNPARNYWFVFAAMTIGMLAVMAGLAPSLPALMVLAVAVVAANWRQFKLSREEAISTAIVAGLLLVSLPVVWSALRPADKQPQAPAKRPAQRAPRSLP